MRDCRGGTAVIYPLRLVAHWTTALTMSRPQSTLRHKLGRKSAKARLRDDRYRAEKRGGVDSPHPSGQLLSTQQRTRLGGQTFWSTYSMLTDFEAEMRSFKSELGLSPIYQQI